MNPLRVAESLKCIGEGLNARILSNVALFVNCKSAEQLGKAKKIGKVAGEKVEVVIPEKKNVTKGVIYGVCVDISEKEIKDNVKGAGVSEVK